MNIKTGTKVTFEADDCRTYTGTYQGIVEYENRYHVIQVPSYREPNWVRVGSDRELSIKPVQEV